MYAHMLKSYLKIKTFRSEKYKDFIRGLLCCKCNRPPRSEAHHESLLNSGMAIKPPDTQCLPLCRVCHDERELKGKKTFWDDLDVKILMIHFLTKYIELKEHPNDASK